MIGLLAAARQVAGAIVAQVSVIEEVGVADSCRSRQLRRGGTAEDRRSLQVSRTTIGIGGLILIVVTIERAIATALELEDTLLGILLNKELVEHILGVSQRILLLYDLITAGDVLCLLRGDDLVTVFHATSIVRHAMSDRSTPQVDISQDGVDGISRNPAHAAPVAQRETAGTQGVLAGLLQILDTLLQNVGRCRLWQLALLTGVHIGRGGVGHVAEVTHQIEVAEGTECEHLRTVYLIVALGVVGVYLHHLGSTAEHDVAAVDDIIEGSPKRKHIGRLHIGGSDFVECQHNGIVVVRHL